MVRHLKIIKNYIAFICIIFIIRAIVFNYFKDICVSIYTVLQKIILILHNLSCKLSTSSKSTKTTTNFFPGFDFDSFVTNNVYYLLIIMQTSVDNNSEINLISQVIISLDKVNITRNK